MMEQKKQNLSDYDPSTVPSGEGMKIGLVAAEWNAQVTDTMLKGAYDTLVEHGVDQDDIYVLRVPGTYELTFGCKLLLESKGCDAVVGIGCVIQGETRHFDFICEAVAQGFTNLSLQCNRPVIFSVLTTNTMEQALDRAGGRHGNKGVEGAVTALKMVNLMNENPID